MEMDNIIYIIKNENIFYFQKLDRQCICIVQYPCSIER